jgi:hypothetical protein
LHQKPSISKEFKLFMSRGVRQQSTVQVLQTGEPGFA